MWVGGTGVLSHLATQIDVFWIPYRLYHNLVLTASPQKVKIEHEEST